MLNPDYNLNSDYGSLEQVCLNLLVVDMELFLEENIQKSGGEYL
jgi:hypothetical protein